MNAFAVKHDEKMGQFEDHRVLECRSNEPYEEFCKVDPQPANY